MNGSFGNVVVDGECAIKSLRDNDCFPYFVREAAALRLLDNRICNVIHLNKIVGDQLYLRKCSCNLKDASDKIDLEPGDIYAICYKLLVVLHNLQMMGLSHRDVKLENILCDTYTDGGETYILDVFLCDFGLARYHNGVIPEHITGTIQTEFYRAPELLFHKSADNTVGSIKDIEHDINNIDIWSLGICMVVMLKLGMLLPQIFTEEEYKLLYGADCFPVQDDVFRQHDIDMDFIDAIKMMLTMDWKYRAPASVLLNLPFFDRYRLCDVSRALNINDILTFRAQRQELLLDKYNKSRLKPSYQKDYDKFMEVLPYFQFNNNESAKLTQVLYNILYGATDISEDDINEIAALASMIYDSEIMLYDKSRCIELLEYLDYDLMWS